MSEIPFDQLAGDELRPDVAVETNLTSGVTAAPSKDRRVLILGYKTTAGSVADQVIKSVLSEQDARTYWGPGSHMAMMVAAALKVSPRLRLYGMSYAEGGAAVAATGTVTLATTATGPGTLVVHIAGRRISVGIAKDDTPTEVGDALEAAINAKTDLPVTAANAAGTVTLTAKNKGPTGDTIRFRSQIYGTTGMTATDSGATLSGGTTEGDPTTALTKALGQRFHLICLNTNDDTAASAVQDHQEAQSLPSASRWGMGICAEAGTLSDATTLTAALDSYRMQVGWLASSDQPVWEIAAAFAARRAQVVERNKSLDDDVLPGLSAPYDESAWPSSAEVEEALQHGVTPLFVSEERDGKVRVSRSVITKQAPATYVDHNDTEISDYTDEYLKTRFSKVKGKPFKQIDPPGRKDTITPQRGLAILHEVMRDLGKMDYLDSVEDDIKNGKTKSVANASDRSRLDLAFPFLPVSRVHRVAILKTYTTP